MLLLRRSRYFRSARCMLSRAGAGALKVGKTMTGSEASEKPSLYDRLGGGDSIATVGEDLIDRGMVDPRLNANPRGDGAHHKGPPAGFKDLGTRALGRATGWARR